MAFLSASVGRSALNVYRKAGIWSRVIPLPRWLHFAKSLKFWWNSDWKFHFNEWEFKFLIPLSLPLHLLDSLFQSLSCLKRKSVSAARALLEFFKNLLLSRFILISCYFFLCWCPQGKLVAFFAANEPNQELLGMRVKRDSLMLDDSYWMNHQGASLYVCDTLRWKKGECLFFHYPSVCAPSISRYLLVNSSTNTT